MATEFKIKVILEELYTSMVGISANIFISTRPKETDSKMNDFIVVSLPVAIESSWVGSGHGITNTICRIQLFARDNSKGENINRLDKMLDDVLNKFPIVGVTATMTHPRVVMSGSDDNGFHVVTIQAELTTK